MRLRIICNVVINLHYKFCYLSIIYYFESICFLNTTIRRQRRNSRGGRALEGSAASGAVIGTLNGLNSHRRKNNKFAIYGIAVETAAIKAVPRKSSLFVSRIMPGTTSGDMEAFLRDDFPEVACIELPSKHPDSYASFKVTLNSDNFSKAHTPDRWPSGVYVDRFFQKKTTIA